MNENTMGGIYLEPEKIIKNAEEIAEKSKNDEKFVFRIQYESAARQVVLAEISRLDCEIINQSDSDSTVTVRISMPQLVAIKTLNCIEKVDTAEEIKAANAVNKKVLHNVEKYDTISIKTENEPDLSTSVQMDTNSAIAPLCYGGGSSCIDNSNTMQTAHYLPLALWKEGSICCPGAEQWYRFTASISEADTYTIYTSGSLDTVGYLYDANGTLLASNDDSNGNRNFKITRQLTTGSRYYIKVKAFANNIGDYELRVDYTIGSPSGGGMGSSGGSSCIDNSNTMQTAYHLPLLSWENNCLCCYGAEKWYKFTANASAAHKNGGSGKYNIRTSGPVILTGRLYDSNGSVIASNTAGYDGYGYYISAYLEYGETYYVLTTAKSPESFGNFCIYVGYDAVPTEPEYPFVGMKSAMNIVPNSSYYGSVRCAGAEVWFKFTPQYTREYVIQTTGNTDTVGRIYNRQGELLGQDDDSGAALNFRKRMMLDAGTTYYIAVKAYGDKVGAFYINVTPIISVECIEIVASNTTLGVGGEISLGVKVNPENATNREVVWESDNPSIATVSRNCGLVTGISVGTTTIRARAIDDSGMYGECIVIVKPPVKVEAVKIKEFDKRIYLGQITHLCAEVIPDNAANKTVYWSSNNPKVASINYISGNMAATGRGNAIITAKSGEKTDSVSVNIKNDLAKLILNKNEREIIRIEFETSNKTWLCINHDIIFSDEYNVNGALDAASSCNLYENYRGNIFEQNLKIKKYTYDEMRFIYLVDPNGLASYVEKYAAAEYADNNAAFINYKNSVFEMLYNRQPRYYKRDNYGKWYEISASDFEFNTCISESELIFGMHTIWDFRLKAKLALLALDVFSIIFGGNKLFSKAESIAKYYLLAATSQEECAKNQYSLENLIGGKLDEAISGTVLEWVATIFSLGDDINEITECLVSRPDYEKGIIDYTSTQTGFDLLVNKVDGQEYYLDDLNELIQ